MFRVFNMGLGMLVIVPQEHIAQAQQTLGYDVFIVGEITPAANTVTIIMNEEEK